METLKDEWYVFIQACKFKIFLALSAAVYQYYVSVLSLRYGVYQLYDVCVCGMVGDLLG